MCYVIHFLLPFLAVFLQSTIFGFYSIKGTLPDLVLVFVIFFSIVNGAGKGTIYGFLCGMLEDLYLGRFIGINAIAKALVGFITGRLQGGFFRENAVVGVTAVALGTFMNAALLLILSRLAFASFHIDGQFALGVLHQFIYNTILSAPFYGWYYRSSRTGVLKLPGER